MTGFKWGIFAAGAAVLISIILGIIAGVNILHIFLRALIFGVLFFGLGFGLRFVVNSFFPELLFSGSEETAEKDEERGSRINITVDSTGEYAVPELYKTSGDSEQLGNIEELVSGVFRVRSDDDEVQMKSSKSSAGIDRKSEAGYNNKGIFDNSQGKDEGFNMPNEWLSLDAAPSMNKSVSESPAVEKHEVFQPQFSTSFDEGSGLESLPDLDAMSSAFSGGFGASPAQTMAAPVQPAMSPQIEEFEPERSQNTGNKAQPLQGDFNPKELAKGISTVLSKDR